MLKTNIGVTPKRILILGDGNFSFTIAFLIKILQQNSCHNAYEIITSEIRVDNPEKIKDFILKEVQSKIPFNIYDKIQLQVKEINASAIQKQILGIKGFDEILFNFPTPMGYQRMDVSKLFSEIRAKKLLNEFKIAYWHVPYDNSYEMSYKLIPSAHQYGFKLKQREIFDYLGFEKNGYAHSLHDGTLSSHVDRNIPFVATFVADVHQNSHQHPMKEDEYSGFTDDETLEQDAMIFRPRKQWSPSTIQNHFGKKISRVDFMKCKYEEDPTLYSLDSLLILAQQKKWREVDKRLKILIEAGKITRYIDHHFFPLCKIIDSEFDKLDDQTKENIVGYCQFDLFSKLKVLTGLQVPKLKSHYAWN